MSVNANKDKYQDVDTLDALIEEVYKEDSLELTNLHTAGLKEANEPK